METKYIKSVMYLIRYAVYTDIMHYSGCLWYIEDIILYCLDFSPACSIRK